MSLAINTDNWTNARFENNGHLAMITLGADPDHDKLCYFVTVLDSETEQEQFQKEFHQLDSAITCINERYMDFWTFNDLDKSNSKSEGGCSTCAAH